MKPYLSIPLAIAYVCLDILWLIDFAGLRTLIPFYILAIGAVGVAHALPKSARQQEPYDPNFFQWLLDVFFVAGMFGGLMLFGVASGALFREPIEMNAAANLGVGIAASALCSSFIPRRWLSGFSTRRNRR
jgi:hypothetical protein